MMRSGPRRANAPVATRASLRAHALNSIAAGKQRPAQVHRVAGAALAHIRPRLPAVDDVWCRLSLFNPDKQCPRQNCTQNLGEFGDHLLNCMHGVGANNAPLTWRYDVQLRVLVKDLSSAALLPQHERRKSWNLSPYVDRSRVSRLALVFSMSLWFVSARLFHKMAESALSVA